MTELDDLRARVAELEAERDKLAKRVDEVAWTHHADDYVAHRFNQEWDRAEAAEARVRVQAEQIAALQEALDPPRFALTELRELRYALNQSMLYVGPVGISPHATDIWRKASHWVDRVDSLISETEEWDALALAEGCAAPADEEEK